MDMIAPRLLFADISDFQAVFKGRRYERAGRRVVMIKQGEGTGNAGGEIAGARSRDAHRVGLRVIHYLMAIYSEPPGASLAAYCDRIKPSWARGDRMEIDVEAYSGHPSEAAAWVEEAQYYLHHEQLAPNPAIIYSNEAYLAEAGLELMNHAQWLHVAAYDGYLLGRGEPRLPRGCKAKLLAKQYTDGEIGAQPRVAPGIGPCDNSILTHAGAAHLGVASTPSLKRRR